jgi:exodeoxyribonuclease III
MAPCCDGSERLGAGQVSCAHYRGDVCAPRPRVLTVMTWNIRGAAAPRAREQALWLAAQDVDVLILTEVRSRDGYRELSSGMERCGYRLLSHPAPAGDAFVSIAVRHGESRLLPPAAVSLPHRLPEVELSVGGRRVLVVGVYVPSRGAADQRNVAKRRFQATVMERLSALQHAMRDQDVVLGGDLNVVDGVDRPHYKVFGAWEHEFYRHFADVGLIDSHRELAAECRGPWSWKGRSGLEYRFDYLMTSRSLVDGLRSCRYITSPMSYGLSDHAAVSIQLAR